MVEPCQQHHPTLPPAAPPNLAAGKHEVGQTDPLLLNVACITHLHEWSLLAEPVTPNDQHCLFPSHLKQPCLLKPNNLIREYPSLQMRC